MVIYALAIQLPMGLFCVLFFLKRMQQAAEDDHTPHAVIVFIKEDSEVVLSHYLKTEAELLKKKYCTTGFKND